MDFVCGVVERWQLQAVAPQADRREMKRSVLSRQGKCMDSIRWNQVPQDAATSERNGHVLVRRRVSWMLAAVAGCLMLLASGCRQTPAAAAPAMPPLGVEVTPVVQQNVPLFGEWVATLDGYVNAQIQPHVSGYLVRQDYREGGEVRKGQVLFEIDPRPFQAVLDQAKAQLAQAEAQLGKAALDVKRDTPLARAKAIAQSQLDNDIQAQLGARAAVASARASVEQAQLNLNFTRVTSLVGGIAGIAKGQIGDLVSPSTVLTSVSQVNPIKAYFSISEQQYLEARQAAPGSGHEPGLFRGVPLELILSDGSVYPYKGSFLLTDRQVDQSTGTIRIGAAFPNPHNLLRPGQFGRVRAMTSEQRNALLVPQRAVTNLQGTNQVAVVDPQNTVHLRNVTVGPTVHDMAVIDSGLQPGDRVVVEGVEKVRDGMKVTPQPFHAPSQGAAGGQ